MKSQHYRNDATSLSGRAERKCSRIPPLVKDAALYPYLLEDRATPRAFALQCAESTVASAQSIYAVDNA
jgi:hypothetical protein